MKQKRKLFDELMNGVNAMQQQREGKIRYVAPGADENTRTFRVEVELPNPDGEIPSGISAEAKIPTGSVMAHFVSPAVLSLNDEGKLTSHKAYWEYAKVQEAMEKLGMTE